MHNLTHLGLYFRTFYSLTLYGHWKLIHSCSSLHVPTISDYIISDYIISDHMFGFCTYQIVLKLM